MAALCVELGQGTKDSAQRERPVSKIFDDYAEVAEEFKFLEESNHYEAVFNHSKLCKDGAACHCGVYSFLEVDAVKQALKHYSQGNHIAINDPATLVGMANVGKILSRGFPGPGTNPKILLWIVWCSW